MTDQESRHSSFANSAKEAVVIIFSILVAFSLDAWWEGIQVERDVDDILHAVESEMHGNLSSLATSIAHHEAIADAITKIRDEVENTGLNIESFGVGVIDVEIFEPGTGAMDTLITAGLLGEVDDSDLRLLLGSYEALVRDLNEQETRAVEFRDAARRRLAGSGIRLWDPEDRRRGMADIELHNLLLMRQVEERNAIDSARALRQQIHRILSRMEELD